MISKSIENRASLILDEMKIQLPSVDVEKIAIDRGLKVIPYQLGDEVSGVLFIDKGKGTIGYNPEESKVRRRFTIAHELGHYELHRLDKELFVDEKQFKVLFRNQKSSTGEARIEQEANAFAAAILMPKKLIQQELETGNFDLSDENSNTIRELADKFEVSVQAMTFRMLNLNLF